MEQRTTTGTLKYSLMQDRGQPNAWQLLRDEVFTPTEVPCLPLPIDSQEVLIHSRSRLPVLGLKRESLKRTLPHS